MPKYVDLGILNLAEMEMTRLIVTSPAGKWMEMLQRLHCLSVWSLPWAMWCPFVNATRRCVKFLSTLQINIRCPSMKQKMPMILDIWWWWRVLQRGFWTNVLPSSLVARRRFWMRRWRKHSTMHIWSLEAWENVCLVSCFSVPCLLRTVIQDVDGQGRHINCWAQNLYVRNNLGNIGLC